jgi:hypothetical protein
LERAANTESDKERIDLRSQVMQDGETNLNKGKSWSEMDLFDLKNGVERDTPVAEIADFLCRNEEQVRARIADLGLGARPALNAGTASR